MRIVDTMLTHFSVCIDSGTRVIEEAFKDLPVTALDLSSAISSDGTCCLESVDRVDILQSSSS